MTPQINAIDKVILAGNKIIVIDTTNNVGVDSTLRRLNSLAIERKFHKIYIDFLKIV